MECLEETWAELDKIIGIRDSNLQVELEKQIKNDDLRLVVYLTVYSDPRSLVQRDLW